MKLKEFFQDAGTVISVIAATAVTTYMIYAGNVQESYEDRGLRAPATIVDKAFDKITNSHPVYNTPADLAEKIKAEQAARLKDKIVLFKLGGLEIVTTK